MFVYKRLAFGLCNAPATWSRLIDTVLAGIEGLYCYMDDLLIYAQDEASHYKILQEVFQRLSDNGLAINLPKCEFGKKSVDYLGYRLSSTGIKPLMKKVKSIQNFPEPKTQKDLLHFLGALGYFRTSLKGIKYNGKYENPAEILQVLFKLRSIFFDFSPGS